MLLILPSPAAGAGLLAPVETEISRSEQYRVVLLATLQPLMRQSDEEGQIRSRAGALVEEGRQALVGLDHALGRTKLKQALELLERSYLRYYDPRPMAEVHLLLGVASLEQARPDLARQAFVEALLLDPSLKLDAHYSPQVRAAFADAGQSLPPRPFPAAAELRRLLALSGSRLALVLGVDPVGEHSLLKSALFDGHRGTYGEVESRLVAPSQTSPVGSEPARLGAVMRRLLESRFPAPAPGLVRRPTPEVPWTPPPPPPRPWYRRWYTLAAAGGAIAAITAAIVLPLALREERVEVRFQWR